MTIRDVQQTSYNNSLARFRRGYTALFALMDDLPEELRERSGACGEWSPKQILAHLSGWIVEASQRYRDFEAGDPTRRTYDWDTDYAIFNAQSVTEREHLSWDDTLTDLRKAVHSFSLHAEQVTPEQADADARYEEWLIALWNDCVEHMGQLCRFIAETP